MPHVKICPNCEQQHPPQALNCACGYPLDNLDPVWIADPAPTRTQQQVAPVVVKEVLCTHQDCNALNPHNSPICVYCGRPLSKSVVFALEWPWQETQPVTDSFIVGRADSILPDFVSRLEHEYPNVSRKHAQITLEGTMLSLIDLGSSNGTFLNEQRVTPQQAYPLKDGDRIRFAAYLTAVVRLLDA